MRRPIPQSHAARLYGATVDEVELTAFESLTTPVRIASGTVLMRQGQFGNEAHIVLEGELLVERDGQVVAMIGAGAAVGEHALLLHEPRNATVTAATDAVVAAMSRSEFSTMLEQCPTIGRRILEAALVRSASPTA
jgi:CRP-like cAMP-binding protein